MKIHVSDQAGAWYKEEMLLRDGAYVRFYVRYGGFSTVQPGFSLGISDEEPDEIGAKLEKEGVTYFIEEKDLWYFDDHDLFIEFNSKYNEPEFHYSKQ